MNKRLFSQFLTSDDTLRVYKGSRLLFSSRKDRLLPLLEYIDKSASLEKGVAVFDRIVGNAAALLLTKVFCTEVYSQLGSEPAIKTLSSYGIDYYFSEVVPYIQASEQEGMCPMEKLSLGKSPEEFREALKASMADCTAQRQK